MDEPAASETLQSKACCCRPQKFLDYADALVSRKTNYSPNRKSL